jgi:putative ABC transport system permease protein
MVKSIFWAAVRNLLRYKVYSCITVSGLAFGMAACLLIFLSEEDELGYDTFHRKREHIYRIASEFRTSGPPVRVALTPGPLGPALASESPAVLHVARFFRNADSPAVTVTAGPRMFQGERFLFGEPAAFEMFTFPMVRSSGGTPLLEPFTAVLTERASKKYFGGADPLGKMIRVHTGEPFEFRVTGVMRDLPGNSHLRFDFLASLSSLAESRGYLLQDWRRADFYTYVLLPGKYSPEAFGANLPRMLGSPMGAEHPSGYYEKFLDAEEASRIRFFLQPLTSIHLHSRLEGELEPGGDIAAVYGFLAIALFVLLIACINYMNLSTARSSIRAREVALRKTLGASRESIIMQFIGESLVTVFIALAFALSLTEIALHGFNALSGKELSMRYYRDIPLLGGLLAAAVLVGIASGSYPAWYLSRFTPAQVLRGTSTGRPRKTRMREALVVFQFAVSTFLIICMGLVGSQLAFLRNTPLGFQKERVLVVPMRTPELWRKIEFLKEKLVALPDIVCVSASSAVPIESSISRYEFKPEEDTHNKLVAMYGIMTDRDFLAAYEIPLLKGRNFSPETTSEGENEFIINETAARALGLSDPVGKRLSYGIMRGTVVGVMKDFHFLPLRERIEPLFLYHSRGRLQYLTIRLISGDTRGPQRVDLHTLGYPSSALAHIEAIWREGVPEYGRPGGSPLPFEYFLLDEYINRQYREDERVRGVLGSFALLSVVIACVGLYGLAAFTAEQRAREIGIRKVFGASVSDILLLLWKDFARPAALAQIIAWPAAYVAIYVWLGTYAYRVEISPWIFLASWAIVMTVALATISIQTIRAAVANPANVLRYE